MQYRPKILRDQVRKGYKYGLRWQVKWAQGRWVIVPAGRDTVLSGVVPLFLAILTKVHSGVSDSNAAGPGASQVPQEEEPCSTSVLGAARWTILKISMATLYVS